MGAWWAWAHERGGEDDRLTSFVVTLQATRDVTVLVDAPQVENHTREAMPEGVICSPGELGGNGPTPHRFHINLDANPATVTFTSEPEDASGALPSFKMKRGDTDQIEVIARASRDRHTWTLTIPLLVNGKRVTLPVTMKGHPFVTVAPEDRHPVVWWSPEIEQWVTVEEWRAKFQGGDSDEPS